MDLEQVAAGGHVLAALTAIVLGAAVLLLPKGVGVHPAFGLLYAGALVVVDVAALGVHEEALFGVFHVLAVVSLLTVAVGVGPLLLGRRSPMVISVHAYCMAWSYAGLIAAGSGQLVVTLAGPGDSGAVPVVIAAVLVVSGVLISRRVPRTLGRVLSRP